MMRLPALEPAERACLQGVQPDAGVRVFADRLRQHLLSKLGAPAGVSASERGMQDTRAGAEPAIAIAPELAAAWLALRLGGRPGPARSPADHDLVRPFKAMIRRALAESVINAGIADWPQRLRLDVALGGQRGTIEIFWNGAHAMAWARRTVREKA